jgi:hypothetical protein
MQSMPLAGRCVSAGKLVLHYGATDVARASSKVLVLQDIPLGVGGQQV